MKQVSFLFSFVCMISVCATPLKTVLADATVIPEKRVKASSGNATSETSEKYAAIVKNAKISQARVFEAMRKQMGDKVMELREGNPKVFSYLYSSVRDAMVMQEMLKNDARRQRKTLLAKAEVKEAYREAVSFLLVNILMQKLIQDAMTPENLQNAYKSNPQTQLNYSRAIFDNEDKARAFIKALKKEEFGTLAAKYSLEPTAKQTKGAAGNTLLSQLPKDLQKHVQDLKKGEHSTTPLKINDKTYVVIKVHNKNDASFDDSKPALQQIIQAQALKKHLEALKEKNSPEVFELDGKTKGEFSVQRPAPAAMFGKGAA